MLSEKRREDLRRRVEHMSRFRSLAGATVVEIGADADGVAAQMLVDAGARHVISTNYGEKWPVETIGAIERRRLDARLIGREMEACSIDAIFGVAVLEHIHDLADFFAGANLVLKPGGLFFVQGEPIWSSAKGHHVGLVGVEKHYRFGDPKTNPIPDWNHLIHTSSSMAEDLTSRGVHAGDAQKIAERIYDSNRINRIGYRTMSETFRASPLNLLEQIDNAFKPPAPDMLAAIERGPYGGEQRFEVSGITFAATA
jgi:hypothetical protein